MGLLVTKPSPLLVFGYGTVCHRTSSQVTHHQVSPRTESIPDHAVLSIRCVFSSLWLAVLFVVLAVCT